MTLLRVLSKSCSTFPEWCIRRCCEARVECLSPKTSKRLQGKTEKPKKFWPENLGRRVRNFPGPGILDFTTRFGKFGGRSRLTVNSAHFLGRLLELNWTFSSNKEIKLAQQSEFQNLFWELGVNVFIVVVVVVVVDWRTRWREAPIRLLASITDVRCFCHSGCESWGTQCFRLTNVVGFIKLVNLFR